MSTINMSPSFSGKANTIQSSWTLPGDGNAYVGTDAGSADVDIRLVYKFTIPGTLVGATINSVTLNCQCSVASGGLTVHVGGAGGAGLYDPSGTFDYTKADLRGNSGWRYVASSTIVQSTGAKTLGLGSQAVTDLTAAVVAGSYWTLAFADDDLGTNRVGAINDHNHANKATLTIDYTAGGGGGGQPTMRRFGGIRHMSRILGQESVEVY